MPVVFRSGGLRFHFFSNEGTPREPLHVHVRSGPALAKYWVEPEVGLAANYGFSATELRTIERLISERREEIRRAWDDHFGR